MFDYTDTDCNYISAQRVYWGVSITVDGSEIVVPFSAIPDLIKEFGAEYVKTNSAPAPFKENASFDDLKVGDKVWCQTTYPDGTVETLEGVVDTLDEYFARSSSEEELVYRRAVEGNYGGAWATLTILERPEPTLPTEPGSLVRANGQLYQLDGCAWWRDFSGLGYLPSVVAEMDWTLVEVSEVSK